MSAPTITRSTWLGHEDHFMHLAGSHQGQLFFRYPLTGEFEFSFEAQTGGRPGTDGGFGYGGTRYEVSVADELFIAITRDSRIERPFSRLTSRSRRFHGQYVGQPEFHPFTLSSAAGRVTISTKGRLIWAGDAGGSDTAPWIALQAGGDCNPIFRNLSITGTPMIPREVRMSAGDSLAG